MTKKPIPTWAKAVVAISGVLQITLGSMLMVELYPPGTFGYKLFLVFQTMLGAIAPALAVIVGRPIVVIPQGDSGEVEAPRIVPKVSRGGRP